MNKIFYLLFLFATLSFGDIKNIPFGIKDLCTPMYKSDDIYICFDDDKFKWASYSFDINKKDNIDKISYFLNKDKKYSSIYEQGYNIITLFNINMNDKLSFAISNKNFDSFEKLSNLEKETINELYKSNSNVINIIKGVIVNSNGIKFQADNKIYDIPKYYFVLITDIKERKIVEIFLLSFTDGSITKISIDKLRELTGVNYLFKIKN